MTDQEFIDQQWDEHGDYTEPGNQRRHFEQALQAALAYAREQASQGQVPEGYRLAPVVPTEAMIEAGDSVAVIHREYGEDYYIENTDDVYRAMIAAAPLPQGKEECPQCFGTGKAFKPMIPPERRIPLASSVVEQGEHDAECR